jgi:signal transduction histidine kinase
MLNAGSKKKAITLLALFALLPAMVCAVTQPVITIGRNGKLGLYDKAWLYRDPSGRATLDDLLKKQLEFKPVSTTALGAITDAVWLRFRIDNRSGEDRLYFKPGMDYLKSLDIYTVTGGPIQHTHAGIDTPFASRVIPVNTLLAMLSLPKGKVSVFYVRLSSENAITDFPELLSLKQVFLASHQLNLLTAFYFGLMAALMIYNLYLFMLVKDHTYLYYVLYCLFWSLNMALIYGYTSEFVFLRPSLWNTTIIYCSFTLLFYSLFTFRFFNIRQQPQYPWMKYVFGGLILVQLVPLGLYAAGEPVTAFILVKAISFVCFPVFIGYSIYRFNKGYRPAIFYAIGFTMFNLGVILYVLKDAGDLPYNFFTANMMIFSSAAEALIWAFALSSKLNFFKREADRAQQQSARQLQAYSKSLLVLQENERRRLAHELHDGVSQNLIIEKNRILRQLNKHPGNQEVLEKVRDGIADTIEEVRAIAYGLRPVLLDRLGLTAALKKLAEEAEETGHFNIVANLPDIDSLILLENSIHIFRIVQEALHNIIKHACATEVLLLITSDYQQIRIEVSDNGKGLPQTENLKAGLGIIGIQERVKALNATVDFTNDRGTRLTIEIPL